SRNAGKTWREGEIDRGCAAASLQIEILRRGDGEPHALPRTGYSTRDSGIPAHSKAGWHSAHSNQQRTDHAGIQCALPPRDHAAECAGKRLYPATNTYS